MLAKRKSFLRRAGTAIKRSVQNLPENLRRRYSKKPEYTFLRRSFIEENRIRKLDIGCKKSGSKSESNEEISNLEETRKLKKGDIVVFAEVNEFGRLIDERLGIYDGKMQIKVTHVLYPDDLYVGGYTRQINISQLKNPVMVWKADLTGLRARQSDKKRKK